MWRLPACNSAESFTSSFFIDGRMLNFIVAPGITATLKEFGLFLTLGGDCFCPVFVCFWEFEDHFNTEIPDDGRVNKQIKIR